MVGMLVKIVIAIIAGMISFSIRWWLPVIVFPVSFILIPNLGCGDPFQLTKLALEIRRATFYLAGLIFIGLMIYIFQINIGSWYGWLIGMLLAWLGSGCIAADLEKYLFFRAR